MATVGVKGLTTVVYLYQFSASKTRKWNGF